MIEIGDNPFRNSPLLEELYIEGDNFIYESGFLFNNDKTTLIAALAASINCHIEIPEGVEFIGATAFMCCANIRSIVLPNSIKAISYYAFAWCESLVEVNLPNKLKSIGNMAFMQCNNIDSLKIPMSVTSIGNVPFENHIPIIVDEDSPIKYKLLNEYSSQVTIA